MDCIGGINFWSSFFLMRVCCTMLSMICDGLHWWYTFWGNSFLGEFFFLVHLSACVCVCVCVCM